MKLQHPAAFVPSFPPLSPIFIHSVLQPFRPHHPLTSTQIAESFRRFGVSSTSTSLLAIKITSPSSKATSESIQRHLSEHVQGRQVEPSDEEVASVTDVARLRKLYKLPLAQVKGAKKEKSDGEIAEERKELEMGILAAMALRGAN